MTRLWQWLRGIPCRFCGERMRWPAAESMALGGVCGGCRRDTFAWLDELGVRLIWPPEGAS